MVLLSYALLLLGDGSGGDGGGGAAVVVSPLLCRCFRCCIFYVSCLSFFCFVLLLSFRFKRPFPFGCSGSRKIHLLNSIK